METKSPTIKGMFVNTHIEVLRQQRGEAGLLELEKRLGKRIYYKPFQDVPVRDELAIIELVLQILKGDSIPAKDLEYQAGRLHFENFSQTPYGRLILSQYKGKFKKAMLHSARIASYVFYGVKFESQDLGPGVIKVIMENNDCPIDHFRGLFSAWMEHAGLKGEIKAREIPPDTYEYLAMWE